MIDVYYASELFVIGLYIISLIIKLTVSNWRVTKVYFYMKKQSLISQQTLIIIIHKSLMNNMQPKCLTDYLTLVHIYLQKQMPKYEQRYKDLEQTYKNIMKNYDIQMYTLRLNDQNSNQQVSEEEEIRDDNLLKRIQQYNRIAKPNKSRDKDKSRRNRRNGQRQQGKPKRKVRTTITPAKLQEMNRIFKEYLQNQEKSREVQDQQGLFSFQSDRQAQYGSLKLIGQRLGLGYSTILHKFREYRATRKVKGGALIASINQKRKYKKSREIEQLIERSLAESTFYTAVQLSKYIQEKYKKTLSRSIISRHLGEMGYSYKNIKTTKPTNKNTNCIKQLRKNFAVALTLQREMYDAQVYYIDQCVLTYDEIYKMNQSEQEGYSLIEVHLTLVATTQGIIKYYLSTQPVLQQEFYNYLQQLHQFLLKQGSKNNKILMMDFQNPIHLTDKITQLRNQMKQQNIRIFYQPPCSQQLNLLEWFKLELKRIIGRKTYLSFDSFKDYICEILKQYSERSLQNQFRETQQYIKRSMIMQNF